ncbi:hypothetical protein [Microbaculum sp. FT89]
MLFLFRIVLVAAFIASLSAVLEARAQDGQACRMACLPNHAPAQPMR